MLNGRRHSVRAAAAHYTSTLTCMQPWTHLCGACVVHVGSRLNAAAWDAVGEPEFSPHVWRINTWGMLDAGTDLPIDGTHHFGTLWMGAARSVAHALCGRYSNSGNGTVGEHSNSGNSSNGSAAP